MTNKTQEIKIEDIQVGDKVIVEGKVVSKPFGKLQVRFGDGEDGTFYSSCRNIKQHIPKLFDWSDVKKGMAFKHIDGWGGIFISNHPLKKDSVFLYDIESDRVDYAQKKNLKRAPEHDKNW